MEDIGKLGTSWKLQGATMNQMCTKVLLHFSSFIKYWCKSISITRTVIMEKYEPSWTPQMLVFVFSLINQPIACFIIFFQFTKNAPTLSLLPFYFLTEINLTSMRGSWQFCSHHLCSDGLGSWLGTLWSIFFQLSSFSFDSRKRRFYIGELLFSIKRC